MINIGIVGAGAIGEVHKETIRKNKNCELIAICDISVEKAKTLAEGTKAKVYEDYKKMQEIEALDMVIINLPHFLHKEVSMFFLGNNIPVLLEKPMALTTEECNEMIGVSKESNTPFAVGHVQRYYDSYRKIKEIIQKNELGKLCQMIEIRNVDYFPGRPKWFLDKKLSGGGIVMNYGAHTLDKFSYITGLEVESVFAKGNNFLTQHNVESTAQMLLCFESGVTAMCSYCGNHVNSQYETYFYFTDGVIKVENGDSMWIATSNSPFKKVDLISTDIFSYQLDEFLKMISGEKSNIATPEYSKKIISVLEEAIRQIG